MRVALERQPKPHQHLPQRQFRPPRLLEAPHLPHPNQPSLPAPLRQLQHRRHPLPPRPRQHAALPPVRARQMPLAPLPVPRPLPAVELRREARGALTHPHLHLLRQRLHLAADRRSPLRAQLPLGQLPPVQQRRVQQPQVRGQPRPVLALGTVAVRVGLRAMPQVMGLAAQAAA